jgi:predicted small lipoprotein YifL
MKRLLGSLVLVAALTALAACGKVTDDADDRADDPATTTPSDQPGAMAPQVVDIVSGSAVDGDVAEAATVIEDERALARYVRQFDSHPFVADLMDVIDTHALADGRVLGLAVIEISCDEPPSATVTQVGSRFLVTPGKVIDPLQECFVPVTSVAVLDLPAQ